MLASVPFRVTQKAMVERAREERRLLPALLPVAAPGLLALAGLTLAGPLPWGWALAAVPPLLLLQALLLRRHFRHLDRLLDYLQGLRRGLPPPPPGADPLALAPGLAQEIVETARERDRQRRELEAAMAANEAILSNLPDPLLMLGRSRRVLRSNAAAEELLGGGLHGRDLVGLLRQPGLLEAVESAIGGEMPAPVEFELPGTVERHFSARVVPLHTPALDGTVAIVALHDLTAVHRAERMRADFVANASHELRTPLASLLGFVETLRGPAKDDAAAQETFLAIMHEQAQRMARLVEDLLSLSRIELREHSPPSGRVAPAGLLETVAKGLAMRAEARAMRLELSVADCPAVVGDPDELTQVFQNLLDNAVKYGRQGTEVRIEARRAAPESDPAARKLGRPCLAIAVIDRGEGIPREHIARLTERFYRVDTARSRELGGTGLGLAIVKHIVNRHRGLLQIESALGEGSRFTVYLPLAESREQAA